jgi:hypothetical protein
MFRALLTLCYTATALLGPGACCCSFRALLDVCPSVAHAAEAPAPAKRSCCAAGHGESGPAPAPKSEGQTPLDSDSDPNCPCKQSQETHLPTHPPAESGVEVVGQHHALSLLFLGGLLPAASDLMLAPSPAPGSACVLSGHVLAGRALLAAIHILRC